MMPEETTVSGKIKRTPDRFARDGYSYRIRYSNGQGWGIPVDAIEAEDLRALADEIESLRVAEAEKLGG